MSRSAISSILDPSSIAVVGASRSPQKVGYQVLKNIITSGYRGRLTPINPNVRSLLGLTAYPTLSHMPYVPQLAVIVTPAPVVPPLVSSAASLGIPAAIVISAGFAESGASGKQLQQQLSAIVQNSSIRVLGPNCLGALNTHNPLNATFGPPLASPGSVFLISQSGAMVTGILDWAADNNLGLSHAITLGNRIDIDETEALHYAHKNKHVKYILCYLESFHQPQAFFRAASVISPQKPIILLKGGQTDAGQSASASHTAALASDYALTQSFAAQTGVILTSSLHQFLHAASIFTHTKPIPGLELAIITNAGGPGVVSTDEAISSGLKVVPVSSQTRSRLTKALSLSHPKNPVDILGDALPNDFLQALTIVDRDHIQDAILLIITPQTTTDPTATAHLVADFAQNSRKQVYVVLIGGKKIKAARQILKSSNIPVFDYPREAIELISHKANYHAHISHISPFPTAHRSLVSTQVRSSFRRKLAAGLDISTAFSLLKSYGFTVPRYRTLTALEQVPRSLAHVGKPAVFKTASMFVLHKKNVGGVYTDIMTNIQARLAFRKLKQLSDQVLAQQTIFGGLEIIIGAKRDPQFGPFIVFGLGGSFTDTFKDRSYVFIPARSPEFDRAFACTKAHAAASKISAVPQIIQSARFAANILLDQPDISELEINPLIVTSSRAYAVDIKIQTSH